MFRIASMAAAAIVLAASLTGCSPSDANCIPSGDASKAVTTSGAFDSAPTVSFTKGLTAKTTERSVAIQGNGAQVADGDTVKIEYTLYNGTTGTQIEKSKYIAGQETSYPVNTKSTQFVGLAKAINCTAVGSRIVAVIPNAEGFGANASQAGLGANDTLVFVLDVVSVAPKPLAEATGKPVAPQAGFPDVVFTKGNPTVTIPSGPVPTKYAIETLIQGDGATVAEGATVTVNYEGVDWNSGVVFDSSFDRGQPASFPTTGVIQGFHDALVGQKVGSRVVVIIPSNLGYGDKGSGDKIKGGDTIVFVVDILGVQ
jgi:peptidylprolyl isomerase